jgi:uncharacterized protein (TIGR03435 family)
MRRVNGLPISALTFLAALVCLPALLAPAQTAGDSSQNSKLLLDPAFEVATIRPSHPNGTEWGLGTKGNHFWAHNATIVDLICFAYGLHEKQIIGGPPWFRTERYDVEGVPNFEGRPIRAQLETMLRKLLTDRFQLQVHDEKQQLAVYALTVANGGVKFHKSDAPRDAPSGYGFPNMVPVTNMKVMHMTMSAFTSALQRTVLDKPVVDETGLPDRYDFVLQWTPDESQFIQMQGTGVHVPAASVDADAPPGLFTAIQNQLGLKLEAKKSMANVIIVDRIERPSAN